MLKFTAAPWRVEPYETRVGPSAPAKVEGKNPDGSFRLSFKLKFSFDPNDPDYRTETHFNLMAGRKTLASLYENEVEGRVMALGPAFASVVDALGDSDPMSSDEYGMGPCHYCGAEEDRLPGETESFTPHPHECLWRRAKQWQTDATVRADPWDEYGYGAGSSKPWAGR